MSRFTNLLATTALAVGLTTMGANAEGIRFWTTEEQPDRLAKQQEMAAQFKAQTGTEVEVIPV